MSIFKNGILGGFSGKTGTVVGAKWKGIDVMKARPSHVTNPKTPAQLAQRMRFAMMIGFLSSFTDLVVVGFKLYARKMSAFNAAMSYNVQNAITGTYPNLSIDYSNVMISRGKLGAVKDGAAASSTAGQVVLTWTDNSGINKALSSDKSLILVYNSTRNEAIFTTGGAIRSAETATITVPSDYSGETVEVYLAFANAEETKISNSSHLGSVTVAS